MSLIRQAGGLMTRARVCGRALTATDDGQAQITLDCPLCGWSSTWTGDHGTEVTR